MSELSAALLTDPAGPPADETTAEKPANGKPPATAGSRALRLTLKLVASVVVLFGVFVLAGYLLPSVYAVEESVEIEALPVDFHPEVGILSRWPQWTAWCKENDPKRFSERDVEYGKLGGKGANMSWTDSKNGGGKLKITREDFVNGIEYEVTLDGFDSPRKGIIRYHQNEHGTKVTWRCRGSIGNNPIKRWMHVLFINDAIKQDYRTGLTRLKALGEKQAAERRKLALKFKSKAAPEGGLGDFGRDSANGEEFAVKLLMHDTNHDGKIAKEEANDILKWLFYSTDKNSDGFLNTSELKTLWQELKFNREQQREFQRRRFRQRRRRTFDNRSVQRGIHQQPLGAATAF